MIVGRFARLFVVALGMALLPPSLAGAQSTEPPKTAPPRPVDAVDALAAWRKLDVSRRAVKDQIELCDEDAVRLQRVGATLKPGDGADVKEWTEWGVLLRAVGADLQTCLRAYKKQVSLLRTDSKTLRDMLPAVREAKRMTLGPKQLGEITKAGEDAEREIVEAGQHMVELVETADKVVAEAQRAQRQAGVSKIEPLPPFKSLL